MRKVQALAAQSNLTIRNFTPGATVNKEFYQEWPINDGRGRQLPQPRPLLRPGVAGCRGWSTWATSRSTRWATRRSTNTIGVACVATTFVYVETPPAPPRQAGGRRARVRSPAMKATSGRDGPGMPGAPAGLRAGARPPEAPPAAGVPRRRSKNRIDQEIAPAAGSATSYSPQGRRDPFVSLLKPVSADPGPETRPAGHGGVPHPGGRAEGHREGLQGASRPCCWAPTASPTS